MTSLGSQLLLCLPDRHVLRVDPGENVWPEEWFGAYYTPGGPLPNGTGVSPRSEDWATVIAPNWVGSEGVNSGFDFTLPPDANPAPNSALTLHRITGRIRDAVGKVARSPAIHFKANKVMCFWAKWTDFEPSMGVYDFTALRAAIDAAVAAGW